MCEPVTIAAIGSAGSWLAANAAVIGGVSSAASIGLGAYGMNQQANAAAAAGREATDSANAQYREQVIQINQSATDQQTERVRAGMRTAGTLNAIFADSGLSGNSQDRVVAEADMATSQDVSTIGRNRDNMVTQAASSNAGQRAQIQSRVNEYRRPSLLGTGLQIATVGADYAGRSRSRTGPS